MIYLDNNATTRPLPEVTAAVERALTELWHNPSSVHRGGQAARQAVELARQSVARLLGVKPREIVFTAGATESIDLALRGVLRAQPASKRVLITTAIEHEAVRDCAQDLAADPTLNVTLLHAPLGSGGVVDAAMFERQLDEAGDRVGLVSVQWANNETGAIQPIEAIGRACRERGVPLHCDGTQWVGKLPTDLGGQRSLAGAHTEAGESGDAEPPAIDLLSCSAHKLHGPKGVGALWARRGVRYRPQVLGTQEMERRGGTENVPGILGFGAAAEQAMSWLADPVNRQRGAELRDRFERRVLELCPDASINGPTEPGARLWNTTNIAFPRLEAEALLLLLSERGVAASAGAACSSGSLDPSPVLLAMGVPETAAHGSVRFSLSRETSAEEIDRAADAVAQAVTRLAGSAAGV